TCLDAVTGKLAWNKATLEPDYEYPHWGIASSPLILNDLVIVSPGGKQGAVKAYDLATGELRWVSELKGRGVYLSPMALELLEETHLVTAVEGKIAGLDPATGETRWEYPWKIFMTNAQIAQPLELSGNVFLLSASYGKGAEAIRLKKTEDGYVAERVWKSKHMKTKFSSPVTKDGYVYGLNESSLTCVSAETGQVNWRGKRYGYGRILLTGDKILLLGNTGKLTVVEARPDEFREVSSRQLLSEERCWNGPALVGGYLVLRNGTEIACYDYAAR
ncbi:MAG: PQQ-binding-like beta-propeller repeat protein, partial [Opitutales bacterium]